MLAASDSESATRLSRWRAQLQGAVGKLTLSGTRRIQLGHHFSEAHIGRPARAPWYRPADWCHPEWLRLPRQCCLFSHCSARALTLSLFINVPATVSGHWHWQAARTRGPRARSGQVRPMSASSTRSTGRLRTLKEPASGRTWQQCTTSESSQGGVVSTVVPSGAHSVPASDSEAGCHWHPGQSTTTAGSDLPVNRWQAGAEFPTY